MNVNREPEYNRIMNTAKKIANQGYEDDASYTTRSFSKHGLSRRAKRVKYVINRRAKRIEARDDRREQLES